MKVLRLPDVEARVGLKKTAIYKKMAADQFPRQVKMGTASGWIESEIDAWVNALASARPASSTTAT